MNKRNQKITAIIYKIGGWSALIAALVFRRNMDAEYYLFHSMGLFTNSISSAPQTVVEWMHLMQTQPVLGLILLNALDLVNIILVGLLFFSIVIALWHKNPTFMGISASITAFAIIYFFITNQAFPFYHLSQEFAQVDAAQQTLLSDQAARLLQIHYGNHYSPHSIYPSYLLITIAGFLLGFQMLKSNIFTKPCAWMGILANGIALTYWGFHFLLPDLEFIAPAISALFLLIWYILTGLQLLKHAKALSEKNNQA